MISACCLEIQKGMNGTGLSPSKLIKYNLTICTFWGNEYLAPTEKTRISQEC